MAFLNLEDMKGFVEVILFPEVYKAAFSQVRGGDPIVVRGTLDLSEDHVKIKGTEVKSLQEAAAHHQKTFHLRLSLASLTSMRLEALKEAILANRGPYKVMLHLGNGKQRETTIALSDQYRVDPSPSFQSHVKALFESLAMSLE
jgi:DNA polymerase-3 subunit alpha